MSPKPLSLQAIRTSIFHPGQDLAAFVLQHLESSFQDGHFPENQIIAVTSKIVSLAEGRRVTKDSIEKKTLVERESDHYLGEIGYGCHLTVKHGLLIPSAGIDESNSDGEYYILYPEDPFDSAKKLWATLRQKLHIQNLGVIFTDSHTTPLRRGVTGIALSYWGFKGTKNLVGSPDLFGRPLQMTRINIVDALSTAAVLMMGEAAEQCPLALIQHPEIEFLDTIDPSEIQIPLSEDLYAPILQGRY
jgi:F420-0:gamma-glutamyl ligase